LRGQGTTRFAAASGSRASISSVYADEPHDELDEVEDVRAVEPERPRLIVALAVGDGRTRPDSPSTTHKSRSTPGSVGRKRYRTLQAERDTNA
jgi:hypothetical protein